MERYGPMANLSPPKSGASKLPGPGSPVADGASK